MEDGTIDVREYPYMHLSAPGEPLPAEALAAKNAETADRDANAQFRKEAAGNSRRGARGGAKPQQGQKPQNKPDAQKQQPKPQSKPDAQKQQPKQEQKSAGGQQKPQKPPQKGQKQQNAPQEQKRLPENGAPQEKAEEKQNRNRRRPKRRRPNRAAEGAEKKE